MSRYWVQLSTFDEQHFYDILGTNNRNRAIEYAQYERQQPQNKERIVRIVERLETEVAYYGKQN